MLSNPIRIDPLSSLEEALILASIRNQCRHFLTHDQQELTQEKQTHWYKQIYTQQNPQNYRVWLLKESRAAIIGYFAAKETEEGIYITEGLLEEKRGAGLGTFLLDSMISRLPKRPLYADIFNHNFPSIHLHKKFGFKEHLPIDERVTRFVLC